MQCRQFSRSWKTESFWALVQKYDSVHVGEIQYFFTLTNQPTNQQESTGRCGEFYAVLDLYTTRVVKAYGDRHMFVVPNGAPRAQPRHHNTLTRYAVPLHDVLFKLHRFVDRPLQPK